MHLANTVLDTIKTGNTVLDTIKTGDTGRIDPLELSNARCTVIGNNRARVPPYVMNLLILLGRLQYV